MKRFTILTAFLAIAILALAPAARAHLRPDQVATTQPTDDEMVKAEKSPDQLLASAIEGMETAKARLADELDSGRGTQGVMRKVVENLDDLIAMLEEQGPPCPPSTQPSESDAPPGNAPGREQADAQPGPGQKPAPGQQPMPTNRPGEAAQDSLLSSGTPENPSADIADILERERWGKLPPSLKQEIINDAVRDRFLPQFSGLLRQYYDVISKSDEE